MNPMSEFVSELGALFRGGLIVASGMLLSFHNAYAQRPSITDLLSQIDSLNSQVTALQSNTALELDGVVSVDQSVPLRPTVVFSGVNVQIVNGTGLTQNINGLGNLVVGYDEDRMLYGPSDPICSDGQYPDQISCQGNFAIWASSHKSGSHNLIVGRGQNYSNYGGVVFGFRNTINGSEAVVTGGELNKSTGLQTTVSAGKENIASGDAAAVSGGYQNVASGDRSSASGGWQRTAADLYDWVAGGLFEDE